MEIYIYKWCNQLMKKICNTAQILILIIAPIILLSVYLNKLSIGWINFMTIFIFILTIIIIGSRIFDYKLKRLNVHNMEKK